MDNDRPQSAALICAHLSSIEVVGDLDKYCPITEPDYCIAIYLGNKELTRSAKACKLPALRWGWPEDHQFWFHPSSTINIIIYRECGGHSNYKYPVGQYTGKFIELLEDNTTIDISDKSTAGIASLKLKINLSLISEPDERSLHTAISNAELRPRLDGVLRSSTPTIMALGATLQSTKTITDVVADMHPLLKTSWAIWSSVYKAVPHEDLFDHTFEGLVNKLRETLDVARSLLAIIDTTDVIEEIGYTSLQVASLLRRYQDHFSIVRLGRSPDIDSCIRKCLKSCEDTVKFLHRRKSMDTNPTIIICELVTKIVDAYIQSPLKMIKNDELVPRITVEKIGKWLAAPDNSRNYNEARAKCQKNTCSWFLDGSRFHELQQKAGFLWLKGTVGCGKTVLCSSVIDKIIELRKANASVTYAYFFFDGRNLENDLQLHNKLIRSLIWQLSLQCDGIPATLVDIYRHGHQQLFTNSLEAILHHIINGLHSTYIVIDSLDECNDRKRTLQWIHEIIALQKRNLRLVVASRPERDISNVLQKLDPRCIDLVDNSANHDITMYIEQKLQEATEWGEDMRYIIRSTLTERSQGMFLWVALQLTELKECSTQQSIINQLNSLPKGLYETYDRIFVKIDDEDDRVDTKTFLRWLCFSVRPMKLAEIAEIVKTEDTENGPQNERARQRRNERHVINKCAGFIAESDDGNFKLAHFSIKEYLLSEYLRDRIGTRSFFHLASNELSHSLMARTCLSYLLHFSSLDMVDENVAVSFPLAFYAAERWIFHAQSGDVDKSEPSLTLALAKKLFTHKTVLFNWVRIWNLDNPYASAMKYQEQSLIGPPLYYAALAGLEKLSLQLMEDEDVNAQGGKYGTALQAASAKGHEGIVRFLLEKGAEANTQGGEYTTALVAAVSGGYERIVKLLLEKGADVNIEGGYHSTALRAAVAGGYEGIIELLLEKGANMNEHGGYYATGLQLASGGGNERTVKLLLHKGADMNTSAGNHGNALQAAVAGGHEGVVKLLLEEGANVNAQGGEYGNALCAASAEGYEDIVELLLEQGADVNAQGDEYGDALQAASAGGYQGIVKRLLEKGADVNAQGGEFGDALQAASAGGYDEIVRLLLENGADVNRQGGKYGNAFYAASAEGHEGTVKLLVENGADIYALS